MVLGQARPTPSVTQGFCGCAMAADVYEAPVSRNSSSPNCSGGKTPSAPRRREVDVLLCDGQGVSPLDNAVSRGQHHAVEILLKSQQVEASIHDGANEGILHEAVERDHLEVVKVLLCCESVTRNPYRLRDGFSPLHCAVRVNEYLPTIPLRSSFKDVSCPSYSGMPSRMNRVSST